MGLNFSCGGLAGWCRNRRSRMRSIRSERILPQMPSKSSSTGSADACRMLGLICTSTRCVAWAMCLPTRRPVRSPQKVSASLWLRLIVGLVSVNLLAVSAASAALYVRFKAKNSEFREQTLHNQAALITDYLKTAPEGPIALPPYVIEEFKAN